MNVNIHACMFVMYIYRHVVSLVAQRVKYLPAIQETQGEGSGYPLQYSCLENSMGRRRLVGHSPWGHKQSDTTEQLNTFSELKLGNIK